MKGRLRYFLIAAMIATVIECSLDDSPEGKDYIGSSIEDQHFDDLTVDTDPDVKQQALMPVPPPALSPIAEDITLTSKVPAKSAQKQTTTTSPKYTIITVATVVNDSEGSTDTEPLEVLEQSVTPAFLKPAQFKTTLVDEVVTYAPPSEPPIFSTLVHSWKGTPRPPLHKLNDGEVKHKANALKKKLRKQKIVTMSIVKPKKVFDAPQRLRLVKGRRNLVSHDIGPPGRKFSVPRGWRVIQLKAV
ncbi:hypothetical protein Y032_0016g3056 [Ancylostoma ceylanicum]|uniref:Uncharacterized protein n=1 Tax=Ancylostoma ceylanicum TaxID=53326 RepID=A0A016V6V1_9BILA|nr:hypothetical protein Y032_0016g3056 [Ancylostoma ceylanicum]